MQPLGTFTLDAITSRLLSKLNITDPRGQGEIVEKIRKEINFQIPELIDKGLTVEDKDRYVIEKTITFTNNLFDLKSNSDYSAFYSLREDAYGDIVPVPVNKIEKIFGILYYDNSFMCALYGDTLRLYVGGNISTSGRTFYLKYYRLAQPVVSEVDLVDIPDKYIETLINNVYTVMQGTKDKVPAK